MEVEREINVMGSMGQNLLHEEPQDQKCSHHQNGIACPVGALL